jgi:hypothetical protein
MEYYFSATLQYNKKSNWYQRRKKEFNVLKGRQKFALCVRLKMDIKVPEKK